MCEFVESLPPWYRADGGSFGERSTDFERILRFSRSVSGWLAEQQGIALYQMAQSPTPGAALEIGSFCGKSTIFLALGALHSNSSFFAVDPHKSHCEGGKEQYDPETREPRKAGTLASFQRTLQLSGLQHAVCPVISTSEEARSRMRSQSLKLVFIDGSHDYLDVVLDYYLWEPLIIPGGYLVLHDSNFEGVNRMIAAHLDRGKYSHEGTVGSGGWAMTVWRKEQSCPV